MASYSEAISAYLDMPDRGQAALAGAIGKTQAAVSRYATGVRFPDADTARAIDRATDGGIPFSLWQMEAARRIGLTPDAEAA